MTGFPAQITKIYEKTLEFGSLIWHAIILPDADLRIYTRIRLLPERCTKI